MSIAARKKPEDLLGNNINHPNDYGHWVYFRPWRQSACSTLRLSFR